MIVTQETVTIQGNASGIETLLVRPAAQDQQYPAVILWTDIFQKTGPAVRQAVRLASYGFVVLVPDVYPRTEKAGRVFDFDKDRDAALNAPQQQQLAWIDEDCQSVLAYAEKHPAVNGKLTTFGQCFGGHLALRTALDPRIQSAVCLYPTGLHTGKLCADADAKSLVRVAEINGKVLILLGRQDPHIPFEGRQKVHLALEHAGVRWEARHYEASHAFARDEGPRYDPAAADDAMTHAVAWLRA